MNAGKFYDDAQKCLRLADRATADKDKAALFEAVSPNAVAMQNCETSYLPKIHRSVQRRHGLSIEEVYADHLSGYGEPVILTDAITAWPALWKWNFQFFRERYGEDLIFPCGGVYGTSKRLTNLRQ